MDKTYGGIDPVFTVTTTSITGTDTTGYVGINPSDYSGVNIENEKYLFVSTNLGTGFLDTNLNGNGVEEADSKCNQALYGYPGTGTYKAMIAQPGYRVASVSPDMGNGQVDWVFKPSTYYYKKNLFDGIVKEVMLTNAAGIFDFSLGAFLTNSFYNISLPTSDLMTGMNWDWTNNPNNCLNWSSNLWVDSVIVGFPESTGSGAISAAFDACDGSSGLPLKILCVEQ